MQLVELVSLSSFTFHEKRNKAIHKSRKYSLSCSQRSNLCGRLHLACVALIPHGLPFLRPPQVVPLWKAMCPGQRVEVFPILTFSCVLLSIKIVQRYKMVIFLVFTISSLVSTRSPHSKQLFIISPFFTHQIIQDVYHSRPQRPRSFWSIPRIATFGQVQLLFSANRNL